MELLAYSQKKQNRPLEGRCSTTKCLMVILKFTALAGLPLNLEVEIIEVLFICFDSRARRALFDFLGRPSFPLFSTSEHCRRAGKRRRKAE